MNQEEEEVIQELCELCQRPIPAQEPVHLVRVGEARTCESCNEDMWWLSTAAMLVRQMRNEDVEKLRDLIKSVLPNYATPYPIWQIAESLAKDLAETDWQEELEGTDIKWNPERMFPARAGTP